MSDRSERLGLEPGSIAPALDDSSGWYGKPMDSETRHSIAISLKRIADAICGDPQNTGIHSAVIDIADSLATLKGRP